MRDKCIAITNISIYYIWKNIKRDIKTVNLNYKLHMK